MLKSAVTAGAVCTAAGTRIDVGLDNGDGGGTARNGTLEAGEIDNTSYICPAFASCKALKGAATNVANGNYMIDPDGVGALPALSMYCDMTSDGGGYGSYPVTGGIITNRHDQANSCAPLGLKMVIPRTKAHMDALFAKYGLGYFAVVPGVYGTVGGVSYTNCVMSSTSGCAAAWKAIDNGAWFIRNITYTEPNNDYTAGCWLGVFNYDANGFIFNDGNCNYNSGTSYICSDNAK